MKRPVLFLLLMFAWQNHATGQTPILTADSPQTLAENSKLFQQFESLPTIDFLIDKSPSPTVQLDLSRGSRSFHSGMANTDASREAYLMSAVSNADLIIVGEPLKKNSALTSGGSFIFSDYTIAINRVINAHKGITVLPGQSIIVTQPGGTVNYRGHKVRASVPTLPCFQLKQTYIVFLRLQENGTFTVFGSSAFDYSSQFVITSFFKGKAVTTVEKSTFEEDLKVALTRVRKEESK